MSNIFSRSICATAELASEGLAVAAFMAEQTGDAVALRIPLTLSNTAVGLALVCKEIATIGGAVPVIRADYTGETYIHNNGMGILIVVEARDSWRHDQSQNEVRRRDFVLTICAAPHVAERLAKDLNERFKHDRHAKIEWWHKTTQGADTTTLYLEPPKTTLRPEFYPDLKDPQEYIRRYLASEASVLLMAGPPGTGKTTLLRHMIYENSLAAGVVYDELLMKDDSLFQKFLFGESDILIIEDADTILLARDKDNPLMSRFLNVADGLIKMPNKKLVFTTNITDFGRVDQALMRPGRCFDVLHTRPLVLEEAVAAAKAANLPIPTERREYTLAELFANTKQREARSAGFLAKVG